MRKLLMVVAVVLATVSGPLTQGAAGHAPDVGIFTGTVTVGTQFDTHCMPTGPGLGLPSPTPWTGVYRMDLEVTTAGHGSGTMIICGDMADFLGVYGCHWNSGHDGDGAWNVQPVHMVADVGWLVNGLQFAFSGTWNDGSSQGTFHGNGVARHPLNCLDGSATEYEVYGKITFK